MRARILCLAFATRGLGGRLSLRLLDGGRRGEGRGDQLVVAGLPRWILGHALVAWAKVLDSETAHVHVGRVLVRPQLRLGVGSNQGLAPAGLRLLADYRESAGRRLGARVLAVRLAAVELRLGLVALVHEARHDRRAAVLLQGARLRSELHGDVYLLLLASDASLGRLWLVVHRQEEGAGTVVQVGGRLRLLVSMLCHRVRLLLVQLELLLMVERALVRVLMRAGLPELVHMASSRKVLG